MLPIEILLLLSLGATQSLAQQITYYNDVPLYSSLVMCASSACDSYVATIVACGTNSSPIGPYASCACLKEQNSGDITANIKSFFKVQPGICGASATNDLSSVLAVFSSWCAAVAPQVAATTVTSSTISSGVTASPRSTLVSTSTPTSTNSPTSDNAFGGTASNTGTKLSTSAITGIAIGALLVAAILIQSMVAGIRGRRGGRDSPHELQRLDKLGKYESREQVSGGVNNFENRPHVAHVVVYNNYHEHSGTGNRDSTAGRPVPMGLGTVAAAGLIRSHR